MEQPQSAAARAASAVAQSTTRGFFSLNPELRDMIYRLALLDRQPLWARRHAAACRHSPREAQEWENPPWATWRFPGAVRPTGLDCCPCVARAGLGILATCRQAEAEAAPVFWAENVHCFVDMPQLLGDLGGGNTRPATRALIRHVSVALMDDNRSRFADYKLDAWPVLSKCRGLQTLEIDLEQARGGSSCTPAKLVSDIVEDRRTAQGLGGRNPAKAKLPHLKSFSLAKVRQYHVPAKDFAENNRLELLFAKYSQPLDLDKARDRSSTMRMLREFEDEFLGGAEQAVLSKVLFLRRQTPGWSIPLYLVSDPLDDLRWSVPVKFLYDADKTTEVQFFGTPLSEQTLKDHEEERRREAAYRRANGLLTAEEALAKREEEREERMRKRRELERQIAEAKELRRMERKRVMPAQRGQGSGGS